MTDIQCERENTPKVITYCSLTGLFSGFLGIGGSFLIVPDSMVSIGMPMINAAWSSLVAVAALGPTIALNHAFSGLIDGSLAATFIGGGVIGGVIGAAASKRLSARKGPLNSVLTALIFRVAFYMLWKSWSAM